MLTVYLLEYSVSDDLERIIDEVRDRVLVLEQWRLYMERQHDERNTSIPTWVAITVTGLLGAAGLIYQMIIARPAP